MLTGGANSPLSGFLFTIKRFLFTIKKKKTTMITTEFMQMLVRLLVSIIANWIIIDRLYYQKSKRRDFYFTFMLISIAIFFLVFFMIFILEDLKGKTGIGIGIGLFGIFSIMRYRTDTMPVREMTYLFVLIALSVINAIAASASMAEVLLTNVIVIAAVWICERQLRVQPCKFVQYDRIELISPDRYDDLKAEIEARLGLKVRRIDVGGVDLLRDTAVLKVYYDGGDSPTANSVDGKTKAKQDDFYSSLIF